MEKIEQDLNKSTELKERDDEFFVIRHSLARYQMNEALIRSNDPETAFDPKKQDFRSDLTEEGKEFAEAEAEKFFDDLDSEKDALFFASSDLVRASETAQVYKDVAKKRGFEIITPENVRDDLTEEVGEGEVRKIESLSLSLENMLVDFVFSPKDYLEEVVKDKDLVSDDIKERWKEARKIIEEDDKGTWGRNYYKHSKAIKKIFPHITKTAEDLYNNKFKKIVRLMKFAQKKINLEQPNKNIKVLAFSHENAMLYFLGKNFQEGFIDNCEGVGFKINGPGIEARAKGLTKNIEL